MCHLDFPGQIIKSPQILSHLLLVVAIFPLPHPCAIGVLKSNRQIPTSSISSSLSGRFSAFPHFTSFSCCVSRMCLSVVSPRAAFATAHRPEQWSCGGEQFQAPPRWDTTGAIDFPAQIVKSPQVLSHLLLMVAIFPLPHPCAIRFPKSNRQTPTSPISSAFSGRYFSLPMCHCISQINFSLAAPMCH